MTSVDRSASHFTKESTGRSSRTRPAGPVFLLGPGFSNIRSDSCSRLRSAWTMRARSCPCSAVCASRCRRISSTIGSSIIRVSSEFFGRTDLWARKAQRLHNPCNRDVQRIFLTPGRNGSFGQQLLCQLDSLLRDPQARYSGYPTHTSLSRVVVSTADLLFDQSRDAKIEPISAAAPPVMSNRLPDRQRLRPGLVAMPSS